MKKSLIVISILLAIGGLAGTGVYFYQIQEKKENGFSLFRAVKKGDSKKVQTLLEIGTNPNINLRGYTPLMVASEQGHLNIAAQLLRGSAMVNAKDPNGYTALHAAVGKKNFKITELLLKAGANPHNKLTSGWTAFHSAAQNGSLQDIMYLIQYSKGIRKVDFKDEKGITPLMYASHNGFLEIVKLLVKFKADVNLKSKGGMTSLHFVASAKKEELKTAEFLISQKADVNLQDIEGTTPLMAAAIRNHLKLTWLLVAKGADVRLKNKKGKTASAAATFGSEIQGYLTQEEALFIKKKRRVPASNFKK